MEGATERASEACAAADSADGSDWWVVEPNDLATELGVSPASLRAWLRRASPRSSVDHNTRWTLTETQVAAARAPFGGGQRSAPELRDGMAMPQVERTRKASDEAYVIDLCDEILGERARRQHRFGWLLGDRGSSGDRARLPVDAYYPDHGLVVEYRERQHDEPVAHFDKPDRMTVSGVHRGEQRKLYDRRREEQIPAHGLRLIIVNAATFGATHEDDYVATASPTSESSDACSTSQNRLLSRPHPDRAVKRRIDGSGDGPGATARPSPCSLVAERARFGTMRVL